MGIQRVQTQQTHTRGTHLHKRIFMQISRMHTRGNTAPCVSLSSTTRVDNRFILSGFSRPTGNESLCYLCLPSSSLGKNAREKFGLKPSAVSILKYAHIIIHFVDNSMVILGHFIIQPSICPPATEKKTNRSSKVYSNYTRAKHAVWNYANERLPIQPTTAMTTTTQVAASNRQQLVSIRRAPESRA